MVDLLSSQPSYTVLNHIVLAVVAFSVLFLLYLVWWNPVLAKTSWGPNVAVPETIENLYPSAEGTRAYVGAIPWRQGGESRGIERHTLRCRSSTCQGGLEGSHAYVIEAPKDVTAWFPSTMRDFWTNLPSTYPVATVVVIPADSQIQFVTDDGFDGITPLLKSDGTALNNAINVTGNYAHPFVIINEKDEDVYFSVMSGEGSSEYWTLKPSTRTLLWPDEPYWPNLDGVRKWNASTVQSALHDTLEHSAWVAETMMHRVLRVARPTV